MYYRKANAAMLVYDLTSSDTFYDIKDWVSGESRASNKLFLLCLQGSHSVTQKSEMR